jgi:DNA-binding PadR family transcriptional regulator
MNVKTLCLGALTLGDATGYEIKKTLESSFRRFYEAGFGSIYPALGQLLRDGLVTCVETTQRGRPDKKVYSLTPAGREAFVVDLCREPEPDRIRSEFLVAMRFAELLPAVLVRQFVERRLAGYERDIEAMERRAADGLPDSRRFVVGFGLAIYRAGRDYLATHRHLVEKPAAPEADTEADTEAGD